MTQSLINQQTIRLYTCLIANKAKSKRNDVSSKYIRLDLRETYNDRESIDLSSAVSSNVDSLSYSVEAVREYYGNLDTSINGGVLSFNSHLDGRVRLVAHDTNDETRYAEAEFDVVCTDISEYSYEVNSIVVNNGNAVSADSTSIDVDFVEKKTPIYSSGRTGTTVSTNQTKTVIISANTSNSERDLQGSFEWNGVTVEWSCMQEGCEYIKLNMNETYEDNTSINLASVTSTNISSVSYRVEAVREEWGELNANITNSVLTFASHMDGKVRLIAYKTSDETVFAEAEFNVVCTDVLEYEYSVNSVVVNDNENIAADATSVTVAFNGVKTPIYASYRAGTSVTEANTHVVTVEANTQTHEVTRSGSFTWNGVVVEWDSLQEAGVPTISQDALDLIEYYGVERTDIQVQAVDTFLSELKSHSSYEHLTSVCLPILAPKSNKTQIEALIANNADINTASYSEIVKSVYDVLTKQNYTLNEKNWFIGKNGIRTYKRASNGASFIQFDSTITFNSSLISGGLCINIPGQSKLCDLALRGTSIAVRLNNSSWTTREKFIFPETTDPKMYANSINVKSVKAALNGVSSDAISDLVYADGTDTSLSTNRLLRIDSNSTSNGLSTSFDDSNGLVVSAFFLCKDYAMSQEELNSITSIFRKLILAFWED